MNSLVYRKDDIFNMMMCWKWTDVACVYVDKTRIQLHEDKKVDLLELATANKHSGLLMLLHTVYDVPVPNLDRELSRTTIVFR